MPKFNGPEYKTKSDHKRLAKQHDRVKEAMMDGKWRTLNEIAEITNDPTESGAEELTPTQWEKICKADPDVMVDYT